MSIKSTKFHIGTLLKNVKMSSQVKMENECFDNQHNNKK